MTKVEFSYPILDSVCTPSANHCQSTLEVRHKQRKKQILPYPTSTIRMLLIPMLVSYTRGNVLVYQLSYCTTLFYLVLRPHFFLH